MFAFLNRLFRRPVNPVSSLDASTRSAATDNSFFLNPDEAKTLGNIDYMRTSRVVKKSFPKMVGNKKEKFEISESISATEAVRLPEEGAPVESPTTPSPTPTSETPRRRSDSNLDSFRSMARDLRK